MLFRETDSVFIQSGGGLRTDLPVQSVPGVNGVFSLTEMDEGVISDLLHSLHCSCVTKKVIFPSCFSLLTKDKFLFK